jgi:hypothetical protein
MLQASNIAIVTFEDYEKLRKGEAIELPNNCTRLMFRELGLCEYLREIEELDEEE